MQKKKILYHSDSALAKTGFGRVTKHLLEYLYKTGKYEIVSFACGVSNGSPDIQRTPWKTVGALPSTDAELRDLNQDPARARMASYGAMNLDSVILQEKPDFYFGVQDIWGVHYAVEKPWFNKINSVIWTTLDSLPLHELATNLAPKTKNFWVWSSFAEKELHQLGQSHVKTVHGPIDESLFFPLEKQRKEELRKKFNISKDTFIVGDVFRNQLRKSVPNILEGWSKFKSNTKADTKLMFHTSWSEGWKIHKLADEYGIPHSDILTTYVCGTCLDYQIKPFTEERLDCPFCKAQKSQVTTSPGLGVSEESLNEIYNLMDTAVFAFTSGGLEIPIYEAKLCGVPTLVTSYSCGEEACEEGSGSLPLEWAEYREFETQFRKASTLPDSIATQLQKVYELPETERENLTLKARDWTIKNFCISSIGPHFEKFLDSAPVVDFDWKFDTQTGDPNAQVPEFSDDAEWLNWLYKNILRMTDPNGVEEGVKHWMQKRKEGVSKADIEKFFRKAAQNEIDKNRRIDFSDLLSPDDNGRRMLIVMPESIGDVFCVTALFESAKEQYPNYNLYIGTKPENFEVLSGNPYVHKVIPYVQQMEDLLFLEGKVGHKGYFEVAFLPHIFTQRIFNYQHNGKTNIAFDLDKK